MPLLTTDQQRSKFVTYAPCVVAALSILGSGMTLLTLYRTWRAAATTTTTGGHGRRHADSSSSRHQTPVIRTYHRLMLGISVFDCLFSMAWVIGPMSLPKDHYWPVGDIRGNRATCTLQGVLITVGCASFLYNAMLMVYYLLVIRYSVRESIISNRIEPWMHLLVIGYYSCITVASIFLKIYNPVSSFCFFAAYPFECVDVDEIECERGGPIAEFFDYWLITVPLLIQTCLMILILVTVAWTVFSKYKQSQRFVFQPRRIENSSSDDASPARGSSHRRRANNSNNNNTMEQRSRRVIVQCVLYAVAFINVVLWSNISIIAKMLGDETFQNRHFWTTGLAVFFLPSQGLFNFLIYIRPRYLSVRDEHPDESRWFAIKESVWHPVATSRERHSRHHRLTTANTNNNCGSVSIMAGKSNTSSRGLLATAAASTVRSPVMVSSLSGSDIPKKKNSGAIITISPSLDSGGQECAAATTNHVNMTTTTTEAKQSHAVAD